MSYEVKQCPVCKLGDQHVLQDKVCVDATTYNCTRCGRYSITRTAEALTRQKINFSKLSGWLRERNLFGREIPSLTSTFLEELLNTLPNYSPLEKQNKLLRAIESLTKYPGSQVMLNANDYFPLAWAENSREFMYYIKTLKNRELIEVESLSSRHTGRAEFWVLITAAGWEYLEHHESDIASKTQAFVAMSFDEALKPIYDNAIAKAIESTGYIPLRVDIKPHLERIDAKIIAEIKNSRFMVAEVTQQKAGVYYEAGFAHGLGIPVIWCVRHDELKNVHFDTRQYNHIPWKSEDELREKLEDFILATIGKK